MNRNESASKRGRSVVKRSKDEAKIPEFEMPDFEIDLEAIGADMLRELEEAGEKMLQDIERNDLFV